MLDIRFIRENREAVEKSAQAKGFKVNLKHLLELDDQRRRLLSEIEKLRAERNELSEKLKAGKPSEKEITLGKALKAKLHKLELELDPLEVEYQSLLKAVPNVIPDDTPLGGEEANREEKQWGETKPKDFEPIDHVSWGEARGYLDFERGAKVAGHKFYFVSGPLVELQLAVWQLGLALAAKHGFTPMLVPHLVNTRTLEGAGFSAKDTGGERQIYKIEDEDLNLIATAEIPLTGFHADEILAEAELPKLYAGLSPAYRLEAGAYGKHAKGLYRVHQFEKLELYVFCKPEDSESWHQKLVAIEEELCRALEIPYRLVRIAAGDLGAPAYKKFDVEYWSPVDQIYRELMSCSNVTDYQTRRLNIRYKAADGQMAYLHSLNGTAAAISRIFIALIENHQNKDGEVKIPKALQTYLNGRTTL